MFKLKSLKTSGFKRLDLEDKLEFPDGRLLIHGRNESGKSTILESIHYALYGSALRPNKNASTEDIVNYGRKDAVVELEFTIDDEEYQIRRVLKKKGSNEHILNKREKDGTLSRVSTGATAVNNQILEVLHGIDSDALLNSCLVEQKRLDNIENSNKQERIKAMSSLLNMEAFVDAREKLKKDQSELDKSHSETKQRLQRAKRAAEDYEEATTRLNKAQKRLNTISEEKTVTQESLEKLEKELKIILEIKQVKEHIGRNDTRLEGRLVEEKLHEESLEQVEKAEANISELEKQVPEAEKEYENASNKLEAIEDLLDIQDIFSKSESALKVLSVKLDDSKARHEEANTAAQKMAEINEKIVDYENSRKAEEVINRVQATLMEYIEVQRDAKQIESEIYGIQERLDKQIGAENRIKALENQESEIEKKLRETQNKKTVSIVLMALGMGGVVLFRVNVFFPLIGMILLGAGVFLFTQSKIEPLEANRIKIRVQREANIGDIARMVEYREALSELKSRQLQPSEILASLDSQINRQLMDLPDKPRDYTAFINLTEPSTIDEVRAAIQEDLRRLAGLEAERDSYRIKAETLEEVAQTLKGIEAEVNVTKKTYDEYQEALAQKEKDSEVQVGEEQEIRKLQQTADRNLTKLRANLKQSRESIAKKPEIEKKLQLTREEMGKLLEVIKVDTEKLESLLKEHGLTPEDERKTRRDRDDNMKRLSSLRTEENANNRAVEDSTIVIKKTDELSKEYSQLQEQAENEKFQLESMKKAVKLLDTTRDAIMGGVKQNVEKNMMQFLPALTDNRYNMAQIDETNYRINVYDREAKLWRGKGVFSGATQDQFSLALRLAFAISTIPQTRGARPGFIFLDEPLSGFDAQRRDGFMLLLKEELSKHFHQIIVISHIEELREDFQHHITLDSGKIIEVQR